ncbi:MAG: hypothetical protein COA54_14235 [Thiotrichaceae bacterium]|nr:MAG: hypothetical protein COA54_14235 [Thiotrichaceae bacterium]
MFCYPRYFITCFLFYIFHLLQPIRPIANNISTPIIIANA